MEPQTPFIVPFLTQIEFCGHHITLLTVEAEEEGENIIVPIRSIYDDMEKQASCISETFLNYFSVMKVPDTKIVFPIQRARMVN
jgi:hypothetical protein